MSSCKVVQKLYCCVWGASLPIVLLLGQTQRREARRLERGTAPTHASTNHARSSQQDTGPGQQQRSGCRRTRELECRMLRRGYRIVHFERRGGRGEGGISDGGVDISRVVIGKQGKGPIERERQRDEKESEEEARTCRITITRGPSAFTRRTFGDHSRRCRDRFHSHISSCASPSHPRLCAPCESA